MFSHLTVIIFSSNSKCMCKSKCLQEYEKIYDISSEFDNLPSVPYNNFNNRFLDSFDSCMRQKILKNLDVSEICLKTVLTNCEREFRTFFEEFENLFNL